MYNTEDMIDKIYKYFKIDGLLHIVVAVLLMNVCKALDVPVVLAVATVLVLILLKEFIHDKKLGRGTFEMKDIYAGLAGVLIGVLAYL